MTPDIFISYTSADERAAAFLQQHLLNEGMQVFMASTSMSPGQNWHQETLNALKASPWVLFLASRRACDSAWVQQELGGAVVAGKAIVPIVWDLPPGELPGWVGQYQALNFAHASLGEMQKQMTAIAQRIKSDRAQALVIAGLIIAALCIFGSK